MSVSSSASAIFPFPIEFVWKHVREFDFPKLIPSVKSVELVDNGSPVALGTVRKLSWDNNQWIKQRLIELSDAHYTSSWELIESEPQAEVTACISSLKLHRVSEDNSTLVVWETQYSADVNPSLIKFETKAQLENLQDLRNSLKNMKQ